MAAPLWRSRAGVGDRDVGGVTAWGAARSAERLTARPLAPWPDAAALTRAAIVSAAAVVVWRFLTFTGFNNDHYVHLARAYQMLLGEWPIRDFVDPGLFLMYVVSAAARWLFGPALGTEWGVVAGALAVGAIFTVVGAARLSGSVAIALLVVAIEILLNPRSFGYPKILLYAAAGVAMIAAASRPTSLRIGVLALVTAVAFLFRHDHGVYIGIGVLATVIAASWDEGTRITARRVAMLGIAIAAFLAPWAFFVHVHTGLVSYFLSGIAFSRGEADVTFLSEVPRLRVWQGGTKDNALSWLFYLFHLLPVACLAVAALWRRRGVPEAWRGEFAVVIALSVMAIPMNFGLLRNSLEGRIADAVVPAGLLGAWLLGLVRNVAPGARRGLTPTAMATVLVAMTLGAVVRAADVREQLGRTGVLTGVEAVRQRAGDLWVRLGKRLPEGDQIPSRYAAALLPFIEYVDRCTARTDRLLMTALFPEIYVMADRGFAGGHHAFLSGFYTSEADQTQTIARLERQSVPLAVVVLTRWAYDLRPQIPLLVAYLEEHYRPLTHIAVPETEGVQVYVDNRRVPARADAATGWPCFVE